MPSVQLLQQTAWKPLWKLQDAHHVTVMLTVINSTVGGSIRTFCACSARIVLLLLLQALLGGSLAFLPAEGDATVSPASPRDTSAIEPAPAREALKFMFSPQGAVFR